MTADLPPERYTESNKRDDNRAVERKHCPQRKNAVITERESADHEAEDTDDERYESLLPVSEFPVFDVLELVKQQTGNERNETSVSEDLGNHKKSDADWQYRNRSEETYHQCRIGHDGHRMEKIAYDL